MSGRQRKTSVIIVSLTLLLLAAIIMAHNSLAVLQNNREEQLKKLLKVARLADLYYVEEVNWEEAVEGAITGMLEKLDPHSVYIPPEKVKENKESFAGKYEGIGIQFDIINGYLTVIAPIPGSPSDQLGIRSGDRIIKINGESAIGLTSDEVISRLKGPRGTAVRVTIQRPGVSEPLEFTIVRDVIPISTITAHFMVDDSTGYLAINRFAAITAREVEEKLAELEAQGMKRLLLDLRGNSGGYLHEAVKVAGKFIPGHKLIVYTRGRDGRIDEEYYADQFPRKVVRSYPLIVLIDRGSASASEIVAGAIQDHDRGLIVGENSFGKGLVQKEFSLQDGSAVRITTARYYTPSGRCIQRSYKGKDVEEYYKEIPDSTWLSEDTLKHRPLFHTRKGRPVYGGGGIQPDVYVPHKPLYHSAELMNAIFEKRLFFEFATAYTNRHPELKTSLQGFRNHFQISRAMLEDFLQLCQDRGISVDQAAFEADEAYIRLRLKAEMARTFWDTNGYYYIIRQGDYQFQKALTLFDEARKVASLE